MKINSNITAYITNNAYLQNEKRLTASTARMSSGYKLNTAGDDPANFAIAAKMHSMLKGIDKVKTNLTTGISVIETAEAAMAETQEMIQRMNELAVKGSNGTLSSSDRRNLQDEVDQILKEVDRISKTVEFNGMKLVNGNFQDRGYTNQLPVSVMYYNEQTKAGHYLINLQKSGDTYTVANSTATPLPAGYGNAEALFGSVDPASITIKTETVPVENSSDYIDYVTIYGRNGSEMQFRVKNGVTADPLDMELTGKGSMRLQVGTEEGEVISASIPDMGVDAIGLSGLDLTTMESSREALDKINNAMEYVSRARSRMGAYENRLENTASFMNAYNEDVTSAVSRIRDTDMAEEMTEFTNLQVLTQAGISMLSQANEMPQQALQLIQ